MNNDTYNGWTNYETWLVALWMENGAGESDYWHDRAVETVEDNDGALPEAAEDLAADIEAAVSEGAPESGLHADIINNTLRAVDWQEIARHYVDAVDFQPRGDE